jgi:hypothetical protein
MTHGNQQTGLRVGCIGMGASGSHMANGDPGQTSTAQGRAAGDSPSNTTRAREHCGTDVQACFPGDAAIAWQATIVEASRPCLLPLGWLTGYPRSPNPRALVHQRCRHAWR